MILTIGTRGDVQPFIGVGTALRDAGHKVFVCTTRNFREFVGGHGLEWIDCGVEELKQTDDWLTLTSIDKVRGRGVVGVVGVARDMRGHATARGLMGGHECTASLLERDVTLAARGRR